MLTQTLLLVFETRACLVMKLLSLKHAPARGFAFRVSPNFWAFVILGISLHNHPSIAARTPPGPHDRFVSCGLACGCVFRRVSPSRLRRRFLLQAPQGPAQDRLIPNGPPNPRDLRKYRLRHLLRRSACSLTRLGLFSWP